MANISIDLLGVRSLRFPVVTSGARGAVVKAQFSVLFAYVCVLFIYLFFLGGGGGGMVRYFSRSGCRQNFYLTPLPPSTFFFRPYPKFSL